MLALELTNREVQKDWFTSLKHACIELSIKIKKSLMLNCLSVIINYIYIQLMNICYSWNMKIFVCWSKCQYIQSSTNYYRREWKIQISKIIVKLTV